MEPEEGLSEENWDKLVPFTGLAQSSPFNNQPFTATNLQQGEQNRENSLMLDYGSKVESLFSKFNQASGNLSTLAGCSNDQNNIPNAEDDLKKEMLRNGKIPDWDPKAMLNNLSFLEQKIHQLQELVHIIVGRKDQNSVFTDDLVTQQQQLISADLTSIIIQLISTAGSLLPSVKNGLLAANPSTAQIGQLNGIVFPPTSSASGLPPQNNGGPVQQNASDVKPLVQINQLDPTGNCGAMENNYNCMDAHELKDEDDPIDEEHLPPGSYEILQLEKEVILAPHTHFCTICGKGFKRDANLRMHMRGHGDEYKTPAALAKPHKVSDNSDPVILKRYSCPYAGCKRNKDHKKFQPLKTILCVKNHYKRTHCDKTYTCSRCNTKKFSVIADLKTHEKHCGRDKWLCSCGTTFSRKDKLFGHIALFQGHTPAIPLEENKGLAGSSSIAVENGEASNNNNNNNKVESMAFSFGSDNSNGVAVQGNMDDTYFSLMGFDGCSTGGLQVFSQSAFDDSGSPFPFMISGTKNGLQSGSGDVDS